MAPEKNFQKKRFDGKKRPPRRQNQSMFPEKDSKKKNTSEYHGVLLVDKPAGITSHDVVDRIRKIFGTRRVGHTGTLDPQATGLLVLLLGEATKISEYLMGVDKSYEGTIKLGLVSDTCDLEGEVSPGAGGTVPATMEALQEFASELTGDLDQVPPPYSAKKVAGKKLYEYARKGEKPDVKARPIRVDDFEIISFENDQAEFGIDCTAGTYVRSLAHDLGQKAGCGAILSELRRTDVGSFTIEESHTLDDLGKLETPAELAEKVIPIRKALSQFPSAFMINDAERWIKNGQAIPQNLLHAEDQIVTKSGALIVLCRVNGQAIAIARVDPAPVSPPPRALTGAVPPWYQPIKQFDIPVEGPGAE